MPELTITHVSDAGGDVLQVAASDGANTYAAAGWVSATTNHYDAAAYGANGHLTAGAVPRAMTAAEIGEYALRLVLEQNPQLQALPTPVAFAAPAPVQVI